MYQPITCYIDKTAGAQHQLPVKVPNSVWTFVQGCYYRIVLRQNHENNFNIVTTATGKANQYWSQIIAVIEIFNSVLQGTDHSV